MAFSDIPREVVHKWILEARTKRKKREDYVRERIAEEYPHFLTEEVKRGANTFNALEYLVSDLDSYG